MKLPLEWLRDYVDAELGIDDLAARLVMAGVGVEAVEGEVLELEITANRADLLSIVGLARETGVLLSKPVRFPDVSYAEDGDDVAGAFRIEVPAPDLCPRYTARIVRGVKVGPSPAWMVRRLEAAGIRSVNNVVDVSNYVLLEFGQPLHVFDLAVLQGKRIVVRRAAEGEKIITIDGEEQKLRPDMLVIADAKVPVAVAGVMGGKQSEIGDGTTDVLIESAQFDPVSIRRTSRRLGLASESSYRFERGVEFGTVDAASRRAARLILETAGGKAMRGVLDVAVAPPPRPATRVRPARVSRVLGLEVPPARVREILEGLGCRLKGPDDALEVEAPPQRRDLLIEADYIEEVARIEGYDRIPCDTDLGLRVASDNPEDLVRGAARGVLSGLGAFEVLTWSFAEAGAPNRVSWWTPEPPLPLRDPEGRVERTLRESLVPHLLRVLRINESYKEKLRPVYEIAHVYRKEEGGYGEAEVLGLAVPGDPLGAKGMLEVLAERLQVKLEIVPDDAPPLSAFLEGGTSARLLLEGKPAGYLGAPLKGLSELKEDVGVAELDFGLLAASARLVTPYSEFNRQPPVRRDLSMVVNEGVAWKEAEGLIRETAPATMESLEFIGEYRGRQIGAGKKGWHFTMTFRAADRSLTGEEAESSVKAVAQALERRLGAVQR